MRSFSRKTLSILICVYKKENNYETLRMPELKALARERRLRGYSRLRKAELIAFLQNNEHRAQRPPPPPPQGRAAPTSRMSPSGAPPRGATWELQREPQGEVQTEARQPELEAPLTKSQLKCRRNKDSKLAKKFKNLGKENDNLKSQMEALKDKITKASESTNARFKRKKIMSMKREAYKIAEKLRESVQALKLLEPRVPKDPTLKRHPLNRNKRIEAKIDELNKKIRRVKNRRNKECLIAKGNSLRLDLNWGPRLLEGAFGNAYRRYRIDGIPGMDPDTFLNRIRRFLIDLLIKESRMGAVRSQTTTRIRFRKVRELVELAFNSRMTNVYNLSYMDEIVNEMIAHIKEQIENPALLNSRFVFDEVLFTNVDFHQLNLMRGSSYLPSPNWLARKKTIINKKNEDQECFKWAVIAASRWEEINDNLERISKLKRFEKDFD